MSLLDKMLSGREFRVRVARKSTNGYIPEEMIEDIPEDQESSDVVGIAQGVSDVVISTATSIFVLAAAYKVLDTVCKVIVKKV